MKIDTLLLILILLCIGFLIGMLTDIYFTPYKIYPNHAPYPTIPTSKISVYNDSVYFDVDNASVVEYAATGSMVATLDQNTNGIRIPFTSPEQLHLGDIIDYENDGIFSQLNKTDLIVHRIIGMGYDDVGFYAITRGDNNILNDGKIRLSQIKYKTIAFIY